MSSKASSSKRRASEDAYDSEQSGMSSLTSVPSDTPAPPLKKSKRAETRRCPICDELIPLRLLGAHSDLESKRVDHIIQNVGSTEVLREEWDHADLPDRRSALRAKKSLGAMSRTNSTGALEQSTRTIQAIQRRRKQRHIKLKEMVKEDDEDFHQRKHLAHFSETICPVCLQTVRGDEDVVEAHVNACLAHETGRLDEAERQRTSRSAAEEANGIEDYIGNISGTRGTDFHIRDRNVQDVDDDIDVDGDDEAAFGDAQFTEGDILMAPGVNHDGQGSEVEQEDDIGIVRQSDDGEKTLRDLVAEGKAVRMRTTEGSLLQVLTENAGDVAEADRIEFAVLSARKKQDAASLIDALERKVQFLEGMRVSSMSSLICRICLDPYVEPTASTGCWHTCCRECWLRCLGTTKLCPICKRITGATELRRVYL